MCYRNWLYITKICHKVYNVIIYSFYIALKGLKLNSLCQELDGTHENKNKNEGKMEISNLI